MRDLFFGISDLHCIRGSDLESLQRVSCFRGLELIVKLHKGNVTSTRNQSDFFEPRKPEMQQQKYYYLTTSKGAWHCRSLVEEHGQHHLVSLCR